MKKKTRMILGGVVVVEMAVIFALYFSAYLPETSLALNIIAVGVFPVIATTLVFVLIMKRRKLHIAEDEGTNDSAQRSAFFLFGLVLPQLIVASLLLRLADGNAYWGWKSNVGMVLALAAFLIAAAYVASHYAAKRRIKENG